MKNLSSTLFALLCLAGVSSAFAAQDTAAIEQARKAAQASQAAKANTGSESLNALDHGPRATTTPGVLAQRKKAAQTTAIANAQ